MPGRCFEKETVAIPQKHAATFRDPRNRETKDSDRVDRTQSPQQDVDRHLAATVILNCLGCARETQTYCPSIFDSVAKGCYDPLCPEHPASQPSPSSSL